MKNPYNEMISQIIKMQEHFFKLDDKSKERSDIIAARLKLSLTRSALERVWKLGIPKKNKS